MEAQLLRFRFCLVILMVLLEFPMPHSFVPLNATLAGRVHLPKVGPCVVRVDGDKLVDITAIFPTMRDVCQMPHPAQALAAAEGKVVGLVDDVLANAAIKNRDASKPWLLAPIDLQAIKAAGVTFAVSMLERVYFCGGGYSGQDQ
jgi:fumarylacetoacetate (FAA) hydrolase family protein